MLADEEKGKQGGNSGLAPSSPPPAWPGYRPLRVASVQQECADVRSFVLEALESKNGSLLPAQLPGQFLAFKLNLEPPIFRSYSMSGPQGVGTYRISVKRAGGAGSRYFHDHIQAGDTLQVSAPRGNFTLAAGDNPVVLLSAGIGATPVLAMLHSLADASDAREIWWCYGARKGNEHPFAAESRELLYRLPHAHSFVAYSNPEDRDRQGRDYDAKGQLNLSLLKSLQVPPAADFYLCGPPAFLADLTAGLQSWGVPYSRIHSETFGTESAITPGIAATPV